MPNAKSASQSARTAKNREDSNQSDSAGQDWSGSASVREGNIAGGISGEDRKEGDFDIHVSLTGGIIAQLIRDAEIQLGKTRDCIRWYEDEEQEQLERLKNLQRLHELAELEQQEGEASTEND